LFKTGLIAKIRENLFQNRSLKKDEDDEALGLYLVIGPLLGFILVACGGGGGGGGGTPAKVTIDCGGPDTDGDGLPDCFEKFLGTSIQDEDTDGR